MFPVVPAAVAVFLVASAPATVQAGPLTLQIHPSSRTAHLFHVVDQISGWSEFSHRQYRRHFEKPENGGLSEADEKLLAEHAALRKQKGYGQGPEQTFYTGLDLDAALAAGVKAGHLTAAEAAVERRVLTHFAPRVEALMKGDAAVVDAFARSIGERRSELAALATKAGRLFGVKSVIVPVYLFANPDDSNIGGGYNGGVLTLEIPRRSDAFPSFQHEVFHAFLEPRRADLAKATATAPGFDPQTLNEGLCYALSPGLLHNGGKGADPLADKVRRDIAAGKPLTDSYARYNRYGLALRPLVKAALEDDKQTLDTLLPRAVDAWRSLAEVSLALGAPPNEVRAAAAREFIEKTLRDPGPKLYSLGPGWEPVSERVRSARLHSALYTHTPENYEAILGAAPADAPLLLLVAADTAGGVVPERYRDLLPRPWAEVEAALRAGSTVEAAGVARGRSVVLLAAPTKERLASLAWESEAIGRLAVTDAPVQAPTAGAAATVDRTHRHFYSFGPGWKVLNEWSNANGGYLHAYSYDASYYAEAAAKARPGEPFVLLYAPDSKDRNLTGEFARLLPRPLVEVEEALKRGETVEAVGKVGERPVLLLAAPTTARLEALIADTKLLGPEGIWKP